VLKEGVSLESKSSTPFRRGVEDVGNLSQISVSICGHSSNLTPSQRKTLLDSLRPKCDNHFFTFDLSITCMTVHSLSAVAHIQSCDTPSPSLQLFKPPPRHLLFCNLSYSQHHLWPPWRSQRTSMANVNPRMLIRAQQNDSSEFDRNMPLCALLTKV
jgi:hypothetical protein